MFLRNIKLKEHYYLDDSSKYNPKLSLKNNSTFIPNNNNPLTKLLELYCNNIPDDDLGYDNNIFHKWSNIRDRCQFLRFSKADKSNTIVITHMKDYDKLVYKHLLDTKTYMKIHDYKLSDTIIQPRNNIHKFLGMY